MVEDGTRQENCEYTSRSWVRADWVKAFIGFFIFDRVSGVCICPYRLGCGG